MVVGEGIRLSLAGLLLGTAVSVAVARALPAIVPGAGMDASVFAVAPLALVGVTLIASWIAARRAGAVDPMQALRAG